MKAQLVYITTSSEKEAEEIAGILVNNKMAACVNILGQVKSVYHWDNKIVKDQEYAMIIKTIDKNLKQIIKCVKENHSYENPCIISIDIENGSKEFLQWIIANC